MKRKKIKIYTNFDKKEETKEIFAIIDDNVIKYIDLDNTKMIIDMKNNIIARENTDYLFTLDFNKDIIDVYVKKLDKYLQKEIKTLFLEKKKTDYTVRYLLSDEKVINEYYINFSNNS